MTELRTHDGLGGDSLQREWEMLAEEDAHASFFHSPRFLTLWYEALGDRITARVHTIHRDGRLIGVVPEAHEREGSPTGPVEVRRFLGGTEVTDYLGPVARPEDRGDVAAAYLRLLSDDVDWDEFVAGGLAEDSGWQHAFREAASETGLPVFAEDIEDVCPRVDLSGGYDGYLSRLPGKQRHELGRKTRKLVRDAGEIRLVEVPADAIPDHLDAFLDLAGDSGTAKAGFFSKPEKRIFFHTLAKHLAPDGVFRLHLLEVGGMTGAAAVSLVHGGEWGLYNSAFDPALRALAPGMVLVGQLIELAAAEERQVFDLLRGSEPYKYRFGAVDRRLCRLTIVRP